MPHTLDAAAVRTWCALALDELGRAREEIDAINVYPVADGDTGTNLYLTVESAARAVDAAFDGHAATEAVPTLADAVRAMAHGALIGARGNSGTILAQLLRGMAQVLAEDGPASGLQGGVRTAGTRDGGDVLRRALRQAADSAYTAVAHPVEGTVLTVAAAAADAAGKAAGSGADVARAACLGARAALDATPDQLADLRRAGVVDAGGRGLVAVLEALVRTLAGSGPEARTPAAGIPAAGGARAVCDCPGGGPHAAEDGPAFEVIYLLDADDDAVTALRARLDALGDSLVVVGGDGLWNVHVHVDDAGAAVEAGIQAGRPHRVRITHFG
ncbi:DAK2 domain-containing protein, partial [Streptomyces sp. NPDC057654]|uniref:DAK2 domain-containing protein n=1 Tax=Streptomyces sp. NPDC057654 TaxID=3346196 RepID=UPI0036769E24